MTKRKKKPVTNKRQSRSRMNSEPMKTSREPEYDTIEIKTRKPVTAEKNRESRRGRRNSESMVKRSPSPTRNQVEHFIEKLVQQVYKT